MNKQEKRLVSIIGDRLRTVRRAQDITLQNLADKMDINKATLTRYERGKINLSLTKFVLWMKALNVKVNNRKFSNEMMRLILGK